MLTAESLATTLRAHKLPPPDARKALRLAAGLTLSDAAEFLTVNAATVARWESGDHLPHRANLERYRSFLETLREIGDV
jgi:transcriptional regulator with XRE-family HTH domain